MGPQGSRVSVMAKTEGEPSGWAQLLKELLKTDIYKRSQGKIVRQVTCGAVWVAFALAAYQLATYLKVVIPNNLGLAYGLPAALLMLGFWLGFRIVNMPSFADFLIAVEAEMNKVSWPSRLELVRSSMVVIILMFGLTVVLFGYDTVLAWLLSKVLKITVI
jgi:preprotein translocase subunit SecE